MKRHVGGAGCGACGLGFAIPAPGRFGQPSGPTTRVCLQWLDAGVERRRRKPHGHVGIVPPVPPRKHGPEVKNRHSGAPGGERAPQGTRRRKVPTEKSRLSALCSLFGS